jgi:hypothetical protein
MRVFGIISAIIMTGLLIQGCSKSSNTNNNNYYMKATVGSTAFSAQGLSKVYQTSSYSGGINLTYITGKADNGQVIKITLITNSGTSLSTGTIPLNNGAATADYFPKGLDSSYTNTASGAVIITALAPNIQGSFSFTCADSTVVSNGTFSVLAQQ